MEKIISRFLPAVALTVFGILFGRSLPLAATGQITVETVWFFAAGIALFFWLTVRHSKL